MSLFEIKPRSNKKTDAQLAQKSKKRVTQSTATVKVSGGNSLLTQIKTIVTMTETRMGKYRDMYRIINTEQDLVEYVDNCIANNHVAIDTETDRLDVLTGNVAGVCLYTPGQLGAYIPINHISYITHERSKHQLALGVVKTQMERLNVSGMDVDMFNAKFDIRVIKKHFGFKMRCTWDGFIAARILNENEPENNLKALHKKYCLKGEGDSFTFDNLFKGIPFTMIPISTGYIYAARDPHITYELCEFQRQYLDPTRESCKQRGLEKLAELFHTVEMPLISVIADIEDTGIDFDQELAKKLSDKYTKLMAIEEARFVDILQMWEPEVQRFINDNKTEVMASRGKTKPCKIQWPVSITSPTQLAELIYDVMGVAVVDKKNPRGTGVEILEKIKTDVTECILAHRTIAKLLGTYIDKLPKEVNPDTGRIHASFWQIGADTGRMSSSDPNLQNIPSKNDEIRKMFKASDGYVLLSSDYSAQEPRITAHMSGDEMMIQAYRDGKDLYVEVASIAFNLPYDECKEIRADGTHNKEGKARRNQAKAIVLGVCYSKGVTAIAEDLGIAVKVAQEIYDKVMRAAPRLKAFMEESEQMARDYGYVDTLWGRKRRLPDMQLEPYEFTYTPGASNSFDPLADDEDFDTTVPAHLKDKYIKRLSKAWGRTERAAVLASAKDEGLTIKDNTMKISEATRQCVNSRIQGSAADQTKKAMLAVHHDPILKELGFKLLLPVHDELIGEVPRANAKAAGERLSWCMVEAAKDLVVPSKCDVEATLCWYGKPINLN